MEQEQNSSQSEEISKQPAQQEQVATNSSEIQRAASTKIAAGICGILLGSLGIHKFIIGETAPGVIMLVVTIAGAVLTLGIASFVMAIIGLIEGILYLTKSDEEFYKTYIEGSKGWF